MWRPRSLRLRYTLRALLVFITLFMLWGGYHANRGWRERQAVSVLLERYASIHERQWPWYSPSGWYRKLVGTLWGDRCVIFVSMNAELTAREVEALAALPSLEQLEIDSRNRKSVDVQTFEALQPVVLPPETMRRILSSCTMRSLTVHGCLLSADEFCTISEEQSLTYLSLSRTSLDDDSLYSILLLPQLETLYLFGVPATGNGLSNHPGSKSLTTFWSKQTRLGDEFAAFMARCPKLRVANIFDANATAEFTRRLENHEALEQLSLAGGGLTEDSIGSLLTIKGLTCLPLPQRILTPEVRSRIAKQRPDLIVRPITN